MIWDLTDNSLQEMMCNLHTCLSISVVSMLMAAVIAIWEYQSKASVRNASGKRLPTLQEATIEGTNAKTASITSMPVDDLNNMILGQAIKRSSVIVIPQLLLFALECYLAYNKDDISKRWLSSYDDEDDHCVMAAVPTVLGCLYLGVICYYLYARGVILQNVIINKVLGQRIRVIRLGLTVLMMVMVLLMAVFAAMVLFGDSHVEAVTAASLYFVYMCLTVMSVFLTLYVMVFQPVREALEDSNSRV